MAANCKLRSRPNDRLSEPDEDYDTPKMDSFGNDRLSQSDFIYNSQMENFLSESFGSRFNNLNSLNEIDIRNNLSNIPKEEHDPPLNRVNYFPSQEQRNIQHQEDQQFIPYNDDYQLEQMQPLFINDDYAGGYASSQGFNQDFKFVVAVMPQAKAANRDYLAQEDLLFVKFMAGIGFTFMLNDALNKSSKPMDSDMSIRMSLRFATPVSDDKIRVARCQVHREKDMSGMHTIFPFKINHREAVYDEKNLCVTIPASTVATLTFYCYSSCAGGIDRRPIYLLFELLNCDGSVYQSVELPIKVCANPSRDAPKEEEKKKKQERKGRGRDVSSEIGCEMGEKKGRKRKHDDRSNMGNEYIRMESISPMQNMHTPSPGWNTTMSAPRASTSRRPSKIEFHSPTSNPTNEIFHKDEDDEDTVYNIRIHGKTKYEKVRKYLKTLEENERYSSRNDEDNPFENLTQLTGEMSISTWLSQSKLNEEKYVIEFNNREMYYLDDIESHFTPSLFHSLGMPNQSAARLNKVYLNWLNTNKN